MTSLNPTNAAGRFTNTNVAATSQPSKIQPPQEDVVLQEVGSEPQNPLDQALQQREGRQEKTALNGAKGQHKQAAVTAGYNKKVATALHQPTTKKMAQVTNTAKTAAPTGAAKETKNSVELTLSDGRTFSLPKHSTWHGNKYAYTSVVNKSGKARYTGKLSPQIDKKMRQFLTNMDNAIKAQTKKVATAKAKGSWKNFWSGELKHAQAQLDNLKKIKHFGMRFFYDVQVVNAGKGKPILAQYQGGGKGYDGKGTIQHPETPEGMQVIFNRSNAAVIKEVQSSKEFYRGLGSKP